MNWRRAALGVAAALPVVALFAWSMGRDPRDIPSPMPGKAAPTFALPVFSPGEPPLVRTVGDTVRLADLRGQVVVLNFWASWCLSCRDEHATLSMVAKQYAGRPIHFLGVLYNDDPASGLAWIKAMGGQSYASLNDPGARTAIDYGLYGVPETYFLDVHGRVAYKQTGPASAALIAKVADSLITAGAAEAAAAKAGR